MTTRPLPPEALALLEQFHASRLDNELPDGPVAILPHGRAPYVWVLTRRGMRAARVNVAKFPT